MTRVRTTVVLALCLSCAGSQGPPTETQRFAGAASPGSASAIVAALPRPPKPPREPQPEPPSVPALPSASAPSAAPDALVVEYRTYDRRVAYVKGTPPWDILAERLSVDVVVRSDPPQRLRVGTLHQRNCQFGAPPGTELSAMMCVESGLVSVVELMRVGSGDQVKVQASEGSDALGGTSRRWVAGKVTVPPGRRVESVVLDEDQERRDASQAPVIAIEFRSTPLAHPLPSGADRRLRISVATDPPQSASLGDHRLDGCEAQIEDPPSSRIAFLMCPHSESFLLAYVSRTVAEVWALRSSDGAAAQGMRKLARFQLARDRRLAVRVVHE